MRVFITLLLLLIANVIFTPPSISANNLLPGEEDYFPIADPMPEPVEGMPGLIKKIQYPAAAKKTGIEGRVIAMAYINENGGVDDVKIIRGLGGGCDEEVQRVVKESKFKPGYQAGKPVKTKLTLSFTFKLT